MNALQQQTSSEPRPVAPSTARRRHVPSRAAGFTLMEVLAALTIGSLVVMSAIGATRALTTAREKVEQRAERCAEARRALETIVGGLRNVRRDTSDPDKPVIIGHGSGGAGSDRINLLVVGDKRVRRDGSESDQYEMAFFLSATSPAQPLPALMCRRDHALDDYIEEGGVASSVADGIVSLSFEYYSTGQWYREWPATELQPPQAVRVTVAAASAPRAPARGKPDVLVLSTVVPIRAAARPMPNAADNRNSGGPRS